MVVKLNPSSIRSILVHFTWSQKALLPSIARRGLSCLLHPQHIHRRLQYGIRVQPNLLHPSSTIQESRSTKNDKHILISWNLLRITCSIIHYGYRLCLTLNKSSIAWRNAPNCESVYRSGRKLFSENTCRLTSTTGIPISWKVSWVRPIKPSTPNQPWSIFLTSNPTGPYFRLICYIHLNLFRVCNCSSLCTWNKL